ncbi:MAG: hypothetical protein AAGA10_10150 [Bacteroidota bacterium]
MNEYSSEVHTLVWLSVEEIQKPELQDAILPSAFWEYVNWVGLALLAQYEGSLLSSPSSYELKISFPTPLGAFQWANEICRTLSTESQVGCSLAIHCGKGSHSTPSVSERQCRQMAGILPGISLVYTQEVASVIEEQLGITSFHLGLFSLGSVERPLPLYTNTRPETATSISPFVPQNRYQAPTWVSNVAAFFILLSSGLSWHALNQGGYFDSLQHNSRQEIRTIVISPFENQTHIPALDELTSDWILKGIQESEIGRSYVEENMGRLNTQKLIEAHDQLHTYFLVEGNIREQDGQLHMEARIRNLLSKQVLFEIPPLKAEPNEAAALVGRLQRNLLEYWVSPDEIKIGGTPPSTDTYQEYLMGRFHQRENVPLASAYYLKAFSSDSTFYPALQAYAQCQLANGLMEQVDATISFLEEKEDKLSKGEKLHLRALVARRSRDWNNLYQLWEGPYEKFWPPDYATYQKVELLLYQNKVQPALDLLEGVFEDRASFEELPPPQVEKIISQWSYGYYTSNSPEAALSLKAKFSPDLAETLLPEGEVFSLVQLRRWRSLDQIQESIRQKGNSALLGKFLQTVSTACFISGEDSLFHLFKGEMEPFLVEYPEYKEQEFWLLSLAESELLSHNYSRVLELIDQMHFPSQKGELHMRLLAMKGYAAANMGDEVSAKKCQIALNQNGDLMDWGYYGQAIIESSLGNQAQAVALLETALENGMKFMPKTFTMDPLLRNLLDYEPYQLLVQPKS